MLTILIAIIILLSPSFPFLSIEPLAPHSLHPAADGSHEYDHYTGEKKEVCLMERGPYLAGRHHFVGEWREGYMDGKGEIAGPAVPGTKPLESREDAWGRYTFFTDGQRSEVPGIRELLYD